MKTLQQQDFHKLLLWWCIKLQTAWQGGLYIASKWIITPFKSRKIQARPSCLHCTWLRLTGTRLNPAVNWLKLTGVNTHHRGVNSWLLWQRHQISAGSNASHLPPQRTPPPSCHTEAVNTKPTDRQWIITQTCNGRSAYKNMLGAIVYSSIYASSWYQNRLVRGQCD